MFRLSPRTLARVGAALILISLLIPAVPDVDLWGHTLFGGDIVSAWAVPSSDHYSFTSDRLWINHEWLSEVSMYGAFAASSGAGLVALRLALLSLLLCMVWRSLVNKGLRLDAALGVLLLTALVTYPRTQHMRPQLFSLVLFAMLLHELDAFERTRSLARLVLVPFLMAAWSNLHGGFIVGFLPVGLWIVTLVFEQHGRSRPWPAVALLGASVPATLLNPYGLELWRFLFGTVGLERADITEWSSMAGAEAGIVAMWLVTCAAAAWGVKSQRPLRLHQAALVGLLGIASFRVNRLDAFFAIATMMSFGREIGAICVRTSQAAAPRVLSPGVTAAVLVACLTVGGMTLLGAASSDGCRQTPDWLPERDAAAFVARNNLSGRLIVFFNWGEYALWHFSPQLTVSTDGRRETVYSDAQLNGHLELYAGSDAGLAYARGLNADFAWLPTGLPAVARLQGDGWTPIYTGTRSTILSRRPMPLAPPEALPSCFPGTAGRESPLSAGLWR